MVFSSDKSKNSRFSSLLVGIAVFTMLGTANVIFSAQEESDFASMIKSIAAAEAFLMKFEDGSKKLLLFDASEGNETAQYTHKKIKKLSDRVISQENYNNILFERFGPLLEKRVLSQEKFDDLKFLTKVFLAEIFKNDEIISENKYHASFANYIGDVYLKEHEDYNDDEDPLAELVENIWEKYKSAIKKEKTAAQENREIEPLTQKETIEIRKKENVPFKDVIWFPFNNQKSKQSTTKKIPDQEQEKLNEKINAQESNTRINQFIDKVMLGAKKLLEDSDQEYAKKQASREKQVEKVTELLEKLYKQIFGY